ncbi:MAG: cation:proton antiporter [Proteobacteria bacterium]|nr:cation:proton antiporter [Pseudomonadota bacterium]
MTEQHLILFLVVGGAAVVPFLSRRFRIPAAALEIVYGIVLFHTVLHEKPDWFLLLKEIGFIYLMFIAGMELDLRSLVRTSRVLWYAAIPLLSFLVTPFVFGALGYPMFEGVAVAMMSAGIVIPVLKESELLHSPLGRDIVGTALMGELLSIAFLTAVDTYHAHGLTLQAALMVLKLAGLGVLSVLVLKVVWVASWWSMDRVEKVMESEDPTEEGIRVVIVIAFAGALLAESAGVEPILGSFMAGLITSHVFRNKGQFEDKINAVGFGFFTPFFFIGVGADLDMRLFQSAPVVTFSLFLAFMILASKVFPVLLARPMGLRYREALAMALLLSAPLSMVVVAGALGQRMGLLTAEATGALVIAALLASVLFPFLFRPLAARLAPSREPAPR